MVSKQYICKNKSINPLRLISMQDAVGEQDSARWFHCLGRIWFNASDHISATLAGHARFWGCTERSARATIANLTEAKIIRVCSDRKDVTGTVLVSLIDKHEEKLRRRREKKKGPILKRVEYPDWVFRFMEVARKDAKKNLGPQAVLDAVGPVVEDIGEDKMLATLCRFIKSLDSIQFFGLTHFSTSYLQHTETKRAYKGPNL